ncbi:hypothetical protein DFJ43DRAFT_1040560 [Lentinula guzmanii]|uniref:Uncharacterized protein n=1 Tax=Lentinula guzmanii TaxID=2804957 RepID=A0AA38MYD2_9AGAR|nr:hypothetical protein DFJ43DRAFT_1040560 [Lentinula guzmanii]
MSFEDTELAKMSSGDSILGFHFSPRLEVERIRNLQTLVAEWLTEPKTRLFAYSIDLGLLSAPRYRPTAAIRRSTSCRVTTISRAPGALLGNADTSKRKSYRVEKNSPSSIRGQFFLSTPPTCKKVDEIGSGSRVVHHCILVLFKNLFSDIILVTDSGKAGTDFWKCVDEGLKTAHEAKKDDTAKIAVLLNFSFMQLFINQFSVAVFLPKS